MYVDRHLFAFSSAFLSWFIVEIRQFHHSSLNPNLLVVIVSQEEKILKSNKWTTAKLSQQKLKGFFLFLDQV